RGPSTVRELDGHLGRCRNACTARAATTPSSRMITTPAIPHWPTKSTTAAGTGDCLTTGGAGVGLGGGGLTVNVRCPSPWALVAVLTTGTMLQLDPQRMASREAARSLAR